MALIKCDKCGKEVSDKTDTCPHCDAVINPDAQVGDYKCNNCGAPVKEDDKSCPECGAVFVEEDEESSPESEEASAEEDVEKGKNAEQKENDNKNIQRSNNAVTGCIGCLFPILLGVVVMVINGIYTGQIGGPDCDGAICNRAESYALEDIPEMALVWETVKSNELTCEADYTTDDQIVMVKCDTSHDEIIKHFGSSEIWYGYLESADGGSYFRYADANEDVVLKKLRE